MTTNWDKLQESLEGLKKMAPEGFTAAEFSEKMSLSIPLGRQRIGALIKDGTLKFAGNRSTTRIDGRRGVNPVYAEVKGKRLSRA